MRFCNMTFFKIVLIFDTLGDFFHNTCEIQWEISAPISGQMLSKYKNWLKRRQGNLRVLMTNAYSIISSWSLGASFSRLVHEKTRLHCLEHNTCSVYICHTMLIILSQLTTIRMTFGSFHLKPNSEVVSFLSYLWSLLEEVLFSCNYNLWGKKLRSLNIKKDTVLFI